MKSTTKSGSIVKALSILAAVALVFSFLPTVAFAEWSVGETYNVYLSVNDVVSDIRDTGVWENTDNAQFIGSATPYSNLITAGDINTGSSTVWARVHPGYKFLGWFKEDGTLVGQGESSAAGSATQYRLAISALRDTGEYNFIAKFVSDPTDTRLDSLSAQAITVNYPEGTAMSAEPEFVSSNREEWTATGESQSIELKPDVYTIKADGDDIVQVKISYFGDKLLYDNGRYRTLSSEALTFVLAATPSVPVSKRINASPATPTEGITYTFDFVADAADEAGEYDVPSSVDIPTITLTAAAMTGSTQDLSDTAALPDASAFGHAGKYTFKVSEASSATTNWTNDSTEYEINVFVANDGNGGLKFDDTTPFTIKTGESKVSACSFVNTYNGTSDLTVSKTTTGSFADLAAAFPFSVTLTLPSWAVAAGGSTTVSYTVAGGAEQTVAVPADGANAFDDSQVLNTGIADMSALPYLVLFFALSGVAIALIRRRTNAEMLA